MTLTLYSPLVNKVEMAPSKLNIATDFLMKNINLIEIYAPVKKVSSCHPFPSIKL